MTSTRDTTHRTGRFVRETPGSQALERGLLLLRAFRAGSSTLTNASLAERVGLPRPTVSRLTRSLVDSGFLCYDVAERAYRLGPVVLSLADAFGQAHRAPEFALPLMRKVAVAEKVNVGLAVADQTDMIYLAAVRQSRDSVSKLRRVVPGTRVPIEMTSLGLSYLAALSPGARDDFLQRMALRFSDRWPKTHAQILKGIEQAHKHGYCTATFQSGHLLAVGASFYGPDNQLYAVNISYPHRSGNELTDNQRHGALLLRLIADIRKQWLAANVRQGVAAPAGTMDTLS